MWQSATIFATRAERETQVEPGKPEQFCAPVAGIENGCLLSVVAYPVAWRLEIVDDEIHRRFEYVRSEHYIIRPTGAAR